NWLTFPNYIQKKDKSVGVDLTDWKNFRLVCRTFGEVIKTRIQFVIASEDASIPEGIRVLHIKGKAEPSRSICGLIPQYITTLILDLEHGYHSFIELTNKGESFPNVRFLAISRNFPSNFWKPLLQSFPSLIELYTVNNLKCDTPITLRDLEILRVGGIWLNCLLVCPRLKHLFVQGRVDWNTFLLTHAGNLRSFLSKGPVDWFHLPGIRAQFTSLRTYGEPVYYYRYPPGDTLLVPYPKHLCLYPPSYKASVPSKYTVKRILKWTNVRFVTIYLPSLIDGEADMLSEVCQNRGGKVVPLVQ
ncbi:hypothetical protein CPB86DRAFT_779886, partial [Serendipita vermifera]